jgi:uncharacterized protein (TIGR00251 family)
MAVGDDRIRLRLSAPAREGKANRELVLYLSAVLNVPKTAITILRGESSRHKLVSVQGVVLGDVHARLTAQITG